MPSHFVCFVGLLGATNAGSFSMMAKNNRNTPKILLYIGYYALLLQNEEIIHILVSIGDL